MKHIHILPLLVVTLLPGLAAKSDTPRYRLTLLPLRLDSPAGRGGGLNNKGQIVGTILAGRHETTEGPRPNRRIVLWQMHSPLRRLPIPFVAPFPNSPPFSEYYPIGINDKGEVAGEFYSQDSGAITITESLAFVWREGRLTKLDKLPGNAYSQAFGLNNRGDVVGAFNNNLHAVDVPPDADIARDHSFVFRGGQMTTFGFGIACGLNDSGAIIGYDAQTGVLWLNGHRTPLGMNPTAINKWGWIAGSLSVPTGGNRRQIQSVTRACVWKKGRVMTLGRPGSWTSDLNGRGQIVGSVPVPRSEGPPEDHATLWQRGREYDLNHCVHLPKGWIMTYANSINDRGWIIGAGYIYSKPNSRPERGFTFLLTPR